ncbi:MAG TPA: type 2 glycerol-3-phosphate oxidase [Chthoniobacterales bacterium]|jgi:glycerol-3-phosphate dehydrogenase|nr:type 2 glycerol-3-phosphate oxidase [Chthoniobacterales bacterium]
MKVEEFQVFDVIVIGGGVIGAAIARELSKYNLQIAIVERNLRVAQETSAGNSGVIHGGFDPTPGTVNARLNLLGRQLYEDEWFKELNFHHRKCHSMVLAFNDVEKKELHKLYDQGITNGLRADEMEILSGEQCLALEPNLNAKIVAGLLCTSSHSVDPVTLTNKLVESALLNGARLFLGNRVTSITKVAEEFCVETINHHSQVKNYRATFIINAAGHYADVIAGMINDKDFSLRTRRGQYRVIEKTERYMINDHILFMVPTIHGKGVIVAPMLDGHVLVGPTAEEGIAKEDTRLITMEKFEEVAAIAKKIIPGLRTERTCFVFSGSRSICVETDDFWIAASSQDKRFINVAGIASPGLSSAPGVAHEAVALIRAQTEMTRRANFVRDRETVMPTVE